MNMSKNLDEKKSSKKFKVFVRGKFFYFLPVVINRYLGCTCEDNQHRVSLDDLLITELIIES